MMTLHQANQLLADHLGASQRAQHSQFVGRLMAQIAKLLGDDVALWEIIGICHDLDFVATADQRHRHGLLTAIWLDGRLPPDALEAIRAHDHRTGIVSDTKLATALKLSDACAILIETLGESTIAMLQQDNPWAALDAALPDRPYLTDIIRRAGAQLQIPPDTLAASLLAAGQDKPDGKAS